MEEILAQSETTFTLLASVTGALFGLWGLRLYRATVILAGAAMGAVAGAFAGGLAASEQAATSLGLVGAVVGGILAWPLKKALIFLFSGLTAGGLVLFATAGGFPENANWTLFATVFIAAGFLAVLFHEWMVIAMSALVGGTLLFAADVVAQFSSGGDFGHLASDAVTHLQAELAAFAWVLAGSLFVGFAIQRSWIEEGADDAPPVVRRGAYLVTGVLVATLAGSATNVAYVENLVLVTGFTSLSWPAAVALLVPTAALCRSRGIGGLTSARAWAVGMGFGIAIGLLDSALWRVLAERYTLGGQYLIAWLGPRELLAPKILWTAAVFPALFAVTLQRAPEPSEGDARDQNTDGGASGEDGRTEPPSPEPPRESRP